MDHIPKAVRGNVSEVLDGKDQRGIKKALLDQLDLEQVRAHEGFRASGSGLAAGGGAAQGRAGRMPFNAAASAPKHVHVWLAVVCAWCACTRNLQVCDRNVENLSGGELQRFAIAVVAAQEANVYMIDEPSSYLDVRQRLKAAKVRSMGVFGGG